MLDIGWSELAVIALVALVVIGPKDLPRAMATVAKWVRKARLLAREFQSNMDEMVRQAELDELRKQMSDVQNLDLGARLESAVDPDGGVRKALTIEDRLDEVEVQAQTLAPPVSSPVAEVSIHAPGDAPAGAASAPPPGAEEPPTDIRTPQEKLG